MKILRYILFFIAGLIILFIVIGLIKPTVKYGHEITVEKSLKESWAVSQDASNYDQWLDGFKSMDLISGTHGEVGSTYKVVVNPGEGQTDFEMTETIVSIKEFDHVTLHFDSDVMNFDQTLLFSEVDGKTSVKTQSTVKGKGIMMRSMFAIMEMFGGSFQAQEENNMEALKKVINENAKDYYPAPTIELLEENLPEEISN